MPQRQILKNFNLFIDGRGYAGVIEDFTPPVLGIQTEDFRAGGMDSTIAIDMGMEKLETSFTLIGFDRDVLALFGFLPGLPTIVTARGALENEMGIIVPVQHIMKGKIRNIDGGTWKGGEANRMKVTMDLTGYTYLHGGIPTVLIDVPNMIRTVGGIEKAIQVKAAIGF